MTVVNIKSINGDFQFAGHIACVCDGLGTLIEKWELVPGMVFAKDASKDEAQKFYYMAAHSHQSLIDKIVKECRSKYILKLSIE